MIVVPDGSDAFRHSSFPDMKKGSKSLFGKIVAWIHLWPSLISAIVLIFICLTGTIIVYCDEVINWVNRDALYVEHVGKQRLPTEILLARFKEAYPKRRNPGYMIVYRDPGRTVKFNSFDRKTGLSFIFMDPYSGKVIKEDRTIHFFYVTAHLHSSLLWHGPGSWIVSICTIIFLIELITGFILWWPKRWTKTTREQSFTIKWKAKWKRLNYDLHNVFGFYCLSVCLVLTLTGLIIAFKPLQKLTIGAFGGDASHAFEKSLPVFRPDKKAYELNTILEQNFTRFPEATAAQIATYKLDSSGYYAVNFARMVGLKSSDEANHLFFDRYSGRELKVAKAGLLHEKVENMYWALHMGTWMGQLGKFCTFIGGLIATSLPVTGFYIWWNRRKKKKPLPKTVTLNPI